MKHLSHALAVIIPIVAAAVTTLLASPAAKHFLENHPAVAGYVTLAGAVGAAAWHAYKSKPAKP